MLFRSTYGGIDPELTYTTTALGNGDTAAVFSGALHRATGETVDGGPYLIDLGTLSAGSNYTLSLDVAPVSFSITPKAASVTPAAKSKTYGDADPELTGSLVGFLPADDVTATYSRAPGETVTGGPYAIGVTLAPSSVLTN